MSFLISATRNLSKKYSPTTGLLRPTTRNLQVHKELRHFMRPHSTTLCGRCRFLSLLVIVARGFAELLPRMPLPAVPSISIC